MIEPKIGEIFSLHGIKVKTCSMRDDEHCSDCAFAYLDCDNIICNPSSREDLTQVIFKEIEQTKIKPMEVKIQIPDNCELIKDGDACIVKEKKQNPPKSWEEFCERYPIKIEESFISSSSEIYVYNIPSIRDEKRDKNICTSKEEAEAFLALMQLRQLRKAWVGDWEPKHQIENITINKDLSSDNIYAGYNTLSSSLSFPCLEMAEEFLKCFRDLCETAKILL